MSEKASILAEQLEWAVGSLVRACGELGEEEYKWKPTEVSNSVQWQLNHISRIINVALPRLIKGVAEYTPEDLHRRGLPPQGPGRLHQRNLQEAKRVAPHFFFRLNNLPHGISNPNYESILHYFR